MLDFIINFFNYYMIFYSSIIVSSYVCLVTLAWNLIWKHKRNHDNKYAIALLKTSPYSPGISIVAPAYNEEKTIINNVNSLLSLDYPDYEVIIVNDGSKDKTLELLIENFNLVKVPYAYVEKIHTKPVRGIYKTTSDNPVFKKLTVVDKENGGTKADAANVGVNVVSNPYFVCTDVDCILDTNALSYVIYPTLRNDVRVIAVGGSMRMSNGCDVKDGRIVSVRPPRTLLPLFQDLEYCRSYIIGKSGLSAINAVQNVSGGFGLFDTEIAIKAGGYDSDSFAEDMDVVAKMIRYMRDSGNQYRVVQVPEICCWTEGPSNLKVLRRQRTRWGRGLMQMFFTHWDMVFKLNYQMYGLLTLPYIFLFEFFAPVIELLGYLMVLYLFLIQAINYNTIWLIFLALYSFSQLLTVCMITMDISVGSRFKSKSSYFMFILASLLEPFIYHPLNVFFSLWGYITHLLNTKKTWGDMTRRGFSQKGGALKDKTTSVPVNEEIKNEK